MYAQLFLGAAFMQGAFAHASSQAQAFNQLPGSRQSVIIDETARIKYLFPPSRGSSSLVAGISPCQGYEIGSRVDYPISGGVISWSALVDSDNIQVRYSTSNNPTSQDDFQDALTNITGGWRGEQCIDGPDFSALGLDTGDNITMQLHWTAGRDNHAAYECADIRLVSKSDFDKQNLETSCKNFMQTTKQRRDDVSNPKLVELREKAEAAALASQNKQSKDGGLSVTEAGVVGAMTTLGFLILVLIAGYFTGAISFGKRHRVEVLQKRGSINSGTSIA